MLKFELDETTGIMSVHPEGRLQKTDFENLSGVVDQFIEKRGQLEGMMIEAEKFPGWENFAAMIEHFQFVRDHHKKIKKIAIVTNTGVATFAEKIGNHFLAAKIKKFPAGEAMTAKSWLLEPVE